MLEAAVAPGPEGAGCSEGTQVSTVNMKSDITCRSVDDQLVNTSNNYKTEILPSRSFTFMPLVTAKRTTNGGKNMKTVGRSCDQVTDISGGFIN